MTLFRSAQSLGCMALAAMLTGCMSAPVPLAANFKSTTQKKVRSAGHWEILAKDVAAETSAMLDKAGVGKDKPVHVSLPPDASAFDRAFRDFLVTEFVSRGQAVALAPGQAVEVNYGAQVVHHNSPRPDRAVAGLTALTLGLYAVHGAAQLETGAQKMAAGLGFAGLADIMGGKNSGGPTHTELVLTTSASDGGRFLARKTDVYYLEDMDVALFSPKSLASGKVMKVVDE
ncbi:MAG: hypothetical protein HGA47_10285 [Zoogloea sp.]|nr:hypothetical protein [Zoogloea sp.]